VAHVLDDSTSLAVDRTRVAFERTMLAWVRTATSLITFGFGVEKFADAIPSSTKHHGVIGLPQFGFIMVCIGLVSLALAAIEHRRNLRELGKQYDRKRISLAVVLAGLIALLGIFALLAMIVHK